MVAPSHEDKYPDAGADEVVSVFYALYDSNYPRLDHSTPFQCETGIFVVESSQINDRRIRDWKYEVLSSELDLINHVVDVVRDDVDTVPCDSGKAHAQNWG